MTNKRIYASKIFYMKRIKLIFLFNFVFILMFISNTLALNARIETIEGEILTIKDFSMDGKRHFYVDWKGGTSNLDWKDIESFEIMRVGQNYWLEVLLRNGNKDSFKIRQFSSFRGKLDFGQWSIPFEKMKRVFFIGDVIDEEKDEKKKEELSTKETDLPHSVSKEVDKVTMRNGDILFGNISAEIVSIRTNYGNLLFKKEDISRLSFGASEKVQKEKELDTLYSKYGDKLTGTIYAPQINIILLTGKNVSVLKEYIREVEFSVRVDSEQKALQEKSSRPASPKIQ